MSYEIPRIPDRVPIPVRLRDQLALVQRMREAYHAPVVYELAEAQAAFDRAPDEQIEVFAAALAAGDPEPDPVIPAARDRLELAQSRVGAAEKAKRQALQDAWAIIDELRPELHARVVKVSAERYKKATAAHAAYCEALADLAQDQWAAAFCAETAAVDVGRPGFGPVPDPPPPLVDLDPNQVDPDAGLGPITRGARQNAREEAARTGKPEPKWDQGRTVQRPRHIEASIFHGTNVPAR